MTTYISRTPYSDITFADAMITAEYPSLLTEWNDLSDATQLVYLNRAADRIDSLNYYYCKYDYTTQVREFPRSAYDDLTVVPNVPQDVMRANVICSLIVWDEEEGVDEVAGLIAIDSRDVTSETIGSASFTYDANVRLDEFARQGIPLPAADLLKKYLRNWRTFDVSRG